MWKEKISLTDDFFLNGTKVKTTWWETMIKECLIAHGIIHTKTWTVLSFFHLKWNLKYYFKFQLYILSWRSSYSKDYVKYEFKFSICSTASLLAAVKKVKLCVCIFCCIYQDWTMVSTKILQDLMLVYKIHANLDNK